MNIPQFNPADIVFSFGTTVATADGTQVGEYGYLSEFYRHPDCRAASYEMRLTLPILPAGDYTVTVRARDCWGNEAKPMIGRVTV